MRSVDGIIIGGGAAGLMCAATAGARGCSVVVLEGSNKVGKKILMSGGGRCNFTNLQVEPEQFLSANPHFCISALQRYTQHDFIDLVEQHGLAYHEKTLGQLFCDRSSKDVLNLLLAECEAAEVEIHTGAEVRGVEAVAGPDELRFRVDCRLGSIGCRSLVVATGGLSVPTLGGSGFGYELAKQFGLRVRARDAALVPFTFSGTLLERMRALAGVSLPASVHCKGTSFTEGLLFTHKGLSGPSVLQISNYWHPGDAVTIDFLPGDDLSARFEGWVREGSRAEIRSLLNALLPKRFVAAWLDAEVDPGVQAKPIAQWKSAEVAALVEAFQQWTVTPAGTEGYQTAEVTRGGVDTAEISSRSFEAKKVPGLFFIGEVLDVTGWLGGYNFQWAWASGHCAAHFV